MLIFLAVIALSHLFIAISYGEEQKQIQITTKMNTPEKIPTGETVEFTIDVSYQGPFSWVKNLEPKFEIVPSRASNDIIIQYDESISDFTIWKGHIHKLQGTMHVSEGTPFEAIFLSVSFEGVVRFNEQVVSVNPDSIVSLIIESQAGVLNPQKQEGEHYNIEIVGLKEEYGVGEEYSFYFVISGHGYSCANYETKFPDENGNIIGMGAEVLCAPEKSMHEFEINSFEQQGTIGNVGIKNPGIYTVSVIFDKPSQYYPTITSKELRVVESLSNLSPLEQIHSGVKFHNVECNNELILIYKKANDLSACVSQTTAIELVVRGWAHDNRILLGCTGERQSKCYPEDPREYRISLYEYYFGSDEGLPTSKDLNISKMNTINACNGKPTICFGQLENGTKVRISCDYPIHGCGVKSFEEYK